jgi:hypothetical protein
MGLDRDVVYDEQHGRLLEGLAASIREKGLAGTQVTDFADKDSCFVELTNMVSRVLLEQVDRAIHREAPLATQIDQAIDTYVDILLSEPGLTTTFASPGLGDRIVIAQRDAVERYARLLVSVVAADAEQDPEVKPVSLQVAYMLVSGCHQAIIRAVARGEDLAELSGEIKVFMKAGVATQSAPVH